MVQPTDERTSSPAPAWKQRLLASRLFVTVHDQRRFVLNVERFVIFGGLVTFLIGIVASAAASTGTFRFFAPLLILFAVAAVAVLGWGLFTRNAILRGDRFDVIALVMVLASIILAGLLNHQAYLGTSDTGFYANDAIHIANTGGRIFDRPEDALLPGMEPAPGGGVSYAAMFGYPAFIAIFYYVGGLEALSWANAPFILLGHLGLYTVGRQLRARSGAVVGLAFYSTSLITVWLERYAMTEVAATAAFWVMAVLVVPLVHKWDAPRAAVAFIPLAYGALVRPEGVILLVWTSVLLGLRWRTLVVESIRRVGTRIRNQRSVQLATAVVVVLGVLTAIQAWYSLPLGYLRRGLGFAMIVFQGRPAPDAHDVPTTGPGPNWGDYALRYVGDSWVAYYLPWFILVVTLAVALRLIPRKRFVWLIALTLPYLLFVLMPPVTVQQPWFMRRYWIALVPLAYLSFGVALDFRVASWRWPTIRKHRARPRWDGGIVASLIVVMLAVPHLDVVSSVMFRSEADGSVQVMETMATTLPPGALIILDESAAGFATLTRTASQNLIVPWHSRGALSLAMSLNLSEDRPTFLVRPSTLQDTTLRSVAEGAAGPVANLSIDLEGLPATPLRFYLVDPPLREGYVPMERYLDAALPPAFWSMRTANWTIEPLLSPVILQKNVVLAEGWNRTSEGLLATGEGQILFNRTLFPVDLIRERHLVLNIAYAQGGTEHKTVKGRSAAGATEIARLPSDGSGDVRVEEIFLPPGFEYDTFLVEDGAVLRGAHMELI